MTSCAVVLVVGARLFGHTSFFTKELKTKSACSANTDFIFPVIAISGFLAFLSNGIKTFISGVLPLLDIQITTSFFNTRPKSP